MGLCFHHDPKLVGLWDQLIRAYEISEVYEIGGPGDVWAGPTEVPDLPRVVFTPRDAVYMPGDTPLDQFVHSDVLYVFGSDYEHNPLIQAIDYVYIPIRVGFTLWSVQAAAMVLYDRSVRNG